jgi:cell division septation protein DedD
MAGLSGEMGQLFGETCMGNNAKLARWLAPCCLFILLLILIMAVVFTSSPNTVDANAIEATVVSQLHQTATAQAKPGVRSTTPPAGQATQKPATPYGKPTPTPKAGH